MPTYEYACRSCGEHLEVVQSFSDDPLTECPNCQGELRKVFSAAGLIFKGSGWHIKDYGSSRRPADGAASGDGASTTKAAESSSASASGGSEKSSDSGSGSASSSTGTTASGTSA